MSRTLRPRSSARLCTGFTLPPWVGAPKSHAHGKDRHNPVHRAKLVVESSARVAPTGIGPRYERFRDRGRGSGRNREWASRIRLGRKHGPNSLPRDAGRAQGHLDRRQSRPFVDHRHHAVERPGYDAPGALQPTCDRVSASRSRRSSIRRRRSSSAPLSERAALSMPVVISWRRQAGSAAASLSIEAR